MVLDEQEDDLAGAQQVQHDVVIDDELAQLIAFAEAPGELLHEPDGLRGSAGVGRNNRPERGKRTRVGAMSERSRSSRRPNKAESSPRKSSIDRVIVLVDSDPGASRRARTHVHTAAIDTRREGTP